MIIFTAQRNVCSLKAFFLWYWQYARADEVDRLRQDYQDGISTLKMFMDATDEKMTAPVQISFLNVRAFVQDVEVNRQFRFSPLHWLDWFSMFFFAVGYCSVCPTQTVGNQTQGTSHGGRL